MSNRWDYLQCPDCNSTLTKTTVQKYIKGEYLGPNDKHYGYDTWNTSKSVYKKELKKFVLGYFCFECEKLFIIGNPKIGTESELAGVQKKKSHGKAVRII